MKIKNFTIVFLCLLAACSVNYSPEAYKQKYDKAKTFEVHEPIAKVYEHLIIASKQCFEGQHPLVADYVVTYRVNGDNADKTRKTVRISSSACKLSSKSTVSNVKCDDEALTNTYLGIAELSAVDSKTTQVKTYSKRKIMHRAFERWGTAESDTCPEIEGNPAY